MVPNTIVLTRWLGIATISFALAACGSSQTTHVDSNSAATSAAKTQATSTANTTATADKPADSPDKKGEAASGTPAKSGSGSNQGAEDDRPYQLTNFELDRPPYAYTLKTAVKVEPSPAPILTKVSEKKNKISDMAAWFEQNGLSVAGRKPRNGPEYPTPPVASYATSGSDKLHYLLAHADHSILMYGQDFSSTTMLLLLDQRDIARGQYDFSTWVKPAEVVAGEEKFTNNEVVWAQKVDDILYVSTMHHTFAKSSKGKNAFLSAIGTNDGELRWQSEPLVCNAETFVIHGAYIICGYGFSKEEDFLYVISRSDGKTVSKTPIKNGPTYIVKKGNQLFVRTYDIDYVFDVK